MCVSGSCYVAAEGCYFNNLHLPVCIPHFYDLWLCGMKPVKSGICKIYAFTILQYSSENTIYNTLCKIYILIAWNVNIISWEEYSKCIIWSIWLHTSRLYMNILCVCTAMFLMQTLGHLFMHIYIIHLWIFKPSMNSFFDERHNLVFYNSLQQTGAATLNKNIFVQISQMLNYRMTIHFFVAHSHNVR